jgi:sporulation protein YlmC with PRC-barrel domain
MMHPTRAGIGLVRLGDSDLVPANSENDLRGKYVYVVEGKVIGSVEDLYIDRQEREVRFLEVGAEGLLGIGKKRFLVPVEAVVEVAAGLVTIEPGRTEKVEGPAPFDTKVAPPRADEPHEDYASPPYGNAEGPDDRLDATLRELHRRTSGGHVGGYGPYDR